MLIAVEGMDGVGKTTISKMISKELDFLYVEKPIKQILEITEENYNTLCSKVWNVENASAFMFCLGNILTRSLFNNIIVDRHILSSFYWDSNDQNKQLFSIAAYGDTIPDLTIILYADKKTRISRIKGRNINDEDLTEIKAIEDGYDKMISFADENNIPYVIINTVGKNIQTVYEECLMNIRMTIKNIKEKGKVLRNEI